MTYVLPPEYQAYNLREVPGFPGYFATADGRLFSARSGGRGHGPRYAWLKAQPHPRTGHLRVTVRNAEGQRATIGVHILVAFAWLGPKPASDMQVCHQDGDPTHNHADNLYWGTGAQNALDRWHHARQGKGLSYEEWCRREDAREKAEAEEYEALEHEAIRAVEQGEVLPGLAEDPDLGF